MGQLIRWDEMIKWDNIVSGEADNDAKFLLKYWNLAQESVQLECGDDWSDEKFALTKAYIFLFGAVNWCSRRQKLSISDTYSAYVSFLIDHAGLPRKAARKLVRNLSFLVENSDEVHPYLRAGEQSVEEFVDGNKDAPVQLAHTLRTQESFGVWSELSETIPTPIAATAH